jgi:hypothetical protein
MILAISTIIICGNVEALKDLFYDHFADLTVDAANWYFPWHENQDGTPITMGRTIYRNSPLPQSSFSEAKVEAQTWTTEGKYILGTDLATKQEFEMRDGRLVFTVRARIQNPAPRGMAGFIFVQGLPKFGNSDEQILFGLLTNEILSDPDPVVTDVFVKGSPVGDPREFIISNSIAIYHTYTLEITPKEIIWGIDGLEVRRSNKVPTGPVQLHLSMWAPADSWAEAYDGTLQPTNVKTENIIGRMLVDYVLVQYEGDVTTSVNDVNTSDKVNIYPNPTHDQINFSEKCEGMNVVICNMTGTVMINSKKINSSLSTAGLPKGLYIVKFYKDNNYYTAKKLIIK